MPEGASREPGPLAVSLAREGVERYVRTGRRLEPPPSLPQSLNEPGAVFVTLRRDGRLRGCIGRFVAARPRLVDELLGVAILAATRDPRYTPVRPDELTDLRYEVSLLGELEPVTGPWTTSTLGSTGSWSGQSGAAGDSCQESRAWRPPRSRS
jgi:uncharacterized protein (TIGR00296 family)